MYYTLNGTTQVPVQKCISTGEFIDYRGEIVKTVVFTAGDIPVSSPSETIRSEAA